ncbi:thioesterase II family protein [Vibrio vulnificus]
MNLIAFGYAGSSNNTFLNLEAELDGQISFNQFVYPGRGSRFKEPFAVSISELAEEVVNSLPDDQPVVLLGYSFGAYVAYETAKYLQKQNRRIAALVVCAMNAPQCGDHRNSVHSLEDQALVDYLRQLGGTPEEILSTSEIFDWYAPIIRSDYRLLDRYRSDMAYRLDCPIFAYFGDSDSLTDSESLKLWATCTSAEFLLTPVPGSHFFLEESPQILAKELVNNLSRLVQEKDLALS